MKNKFILLTVFLSIIFMSSVYGQENQNDREKDISHETENKDEFKSPFRYVIVAGVSKIEKGINSNPEEDRYLEVLVEDSAFTERNLSMLFGLLQKRFAPKNSLTVKAYTSLDAIRTPEEYDRTILWGTKENVESRYKFARYDWINNGEKGSYDYYIPGKVDGKRVFVNLP